jgi:excisionase family DNA binding protein
MPSDQDSKGIDYGPVQLPRLLTAQEVAERLGVPASWVYSAARRGDLPSIKVGRYVRFDPVKVAEYATPREMTPDQLADVLRVDVSWVYRAAKQGIVPAERVGRYVRFDPATIERWLAGGGRS